MIKKPSRKSQQRDEIIKLLRGLKDILDDSPMAVKKSDLQELEQKIIQLKLDITQLDNRLHFMEAEDAQRKRTLEEAFEVKAIMDTNNIPSDITGNIPESKKKLFWRRFRES